MSFLQKKKKQRKETEKTEDEKTLYTYGLEKIMQYE